MKVLVKALEIYRDGVLDDIKVIGDEDDYEKEIGVTYYDITDLNEIKETFKGRHQSTLESYLGKAAMTGQLTLQYEACYLPVKLGNTEVRMVDKYFEWERGETDDTL